MKLRHDITVQRGLSFIEVLVAVVVISVGLLGVIGLQGAAVSNTTLSTMRSSAAIEANNLVARMRANRAFWVDKTANEYKIEIKKNESGTLVITEGDVKPLTEADAIQGTIQNCLVTAGATSACTKVEEMAAYDLKEWHNNIASQLGVAAKVEIEFENSIIEITLSWDEKASAFAGGSQSSKQYKVKVSL